MGKQLGRGRYCLEGIGLRLYWEQITGILAGAGMTMDKIRETLPYKDALEQYREHIQVCDFCRENIRGVKDDRYALV